MSTGMKGSDGPTPEKQNDTPVAEGPTQGLAEATTIGLSEEEQAQLLQEPSIGPYRVIRIIGEGGMGAVYLAERDDDEYRKQVAIKLIRRGMDSESVVRRFKNERQILASLDHPNIARLLDGGTTEDGRPYFVMEYIEGRPINRYSDEKKLTTIERLGMFRQVCSAVHYAHQNLVIHRDIKPSNIIVTADGTPKLLDFGIAKLLDPEASDYAVEATATMARLMTPEYASPEQVKGEQITTATDVYSLGVVLYELLTGHRPYRLTSRLPHDIVRIVCEEEPARPSTIITRTTNIPNPHGGEPLSVTPEQVSRTREGSPEKLRRRLRGDLDNIVLMAMRKEPSRRYSSVDQLSNDIARYLDGRPVIARNVTVIYRAAKFIKRHKAAAIAALLIVVTLVGGIIATSMQRARAERLFGDVRQLANSFMFEIHDAIKDLPGSTPARQLLVKRALEYLDSLASESAGDASLQRELATAYEKVGDVQGNPFDANLGDTAGALESYRKALAIREKLLADNKSDRQASRDFAATHSRIGAVLWTIGDTKEALAAYQKAVEVGESLIASDGNDIEAGRNLWATYRRLGYAQAQAGDLTSGLASFRRAREIIERIVALNPNDAEARRDMSANYTSIGEALGETGDVAGAIEYFNKALAIDREIASADPTNASAQIDVASDYGNIGDAQQRGRDYRGSLESFRNAATITERVASTDPTNAQVRRGAAIFHMKIGIALSELGDYKGALESHKRASSMFESLPQTEAGNLQGRGELSMNYSLLGLVLAKTGDANGAMDFADRGRKIAEELMRANPANAELRGLVAFACIKLADAQVAIATNEKASSDRRAELIGQAREWYQKAFEVLNRLREEGAWISPDYGSPEEIQRKIAALD